MNMEFIEALEELEKDRGISIDVLLEALEAALISAYKRNFGSAQNVRVQIDRTSGEIRVFARKTVVENVEDDRLDISLEDAKNKDPRYELEDIVEIEVTPKDFGRIAAQTAKQVVVQRIREAERGIIFEEFSNREGDIVTGIVQRQDQKNVYVDLGKTEAILAPSEQIPGEEYRHGDRVKTYIVEVKKTTKGPQILVSRTHPGLLKRLFELEVPEIHDGVVELKYVAREAGARSKIAVYSKDENVDPVGACVGPKGMRVQTIVSELKGEKIDIVKWNSDPAKFVSNALSPAKVVAVRINETEKIARVTVPDYQLSLAIGKEGQNARLAAKLTGWKIDIKSESQVASLPEESDFFKDDTAFADVGEYLDENYEGEYTDETYEQYDYEEYDENYEGPYEGEYVEGYEETYSEEFEAETEEFDAEYDEAYEEAYEEGYDGKYDDQYDEEYEGEYSENETEVDAEEAAGNYDVYDSVEQTDTAIEEAQAAEVEVEAEQPEAEPKKKKKTKAKKAVEDKNEEATEEGIAVEDVVEEKPKKKKKTTKKKA